MDLKRVTAALGLYDMESQPLAAELSAMQGGLDQLEAALTPAETVLDGEAMPMESLKLWADTLSIPRWIGLEEKDLRRWVKAFLTGRGFTLKELTEALEDAGVGLTPQEGDGFQLLLTGVERYPLDELRRGAELIRRRAPARAQVVVDVDSPTWAQLDAMDRTAAQWEEKGLDWEAFDFTGGADWS